MAEVDAMRRIVVSEEVLDHVAMVLDPKSPHRLLPEICPQCEAFVKAVKLAEPHEATTGAEVVIREGGRAGWCG